MDAAVVINEHGSRLAPRTDAVLLSDSLAALQLESRPRFSHQDLESHNFLYSLRAIIEKRRDNGYN